MKWMLRAINNNSKYLNKNKSNSNQLCGYEVKDFTIFAERKFKFIYIVILMSQCSFWFWVNSKQTNKQHKQ